VASGGGHHPDLLNDDRMGRMLDTLYAAGVTEVFLEVAQGGPPGLSHSGKGPARRRHQLPLSAAWAW